jgi:hypothetical protein
MTSSDENEDLDEAIYFGVFDAHPDDYYYAAEGGIQCWQLSQIP